MTLNGKELVSLGRKTILHDKEISRFVYQMPTTGKYYIAGMAAGDDCVREVYRDGSTDTFLLAPKGKEAYFNHNRVMKTNLQVYVDDLDWWTWVYLGTDGKLYIHIDRLLYVPLEEYHIDFTSNNE